ncbi:hypothetical protein MKX03_036675 [Papaver bracteatum]|nr:hypothetical protein MKX03_036675 [Papaver bracteatum]
MSCNAQNEDRKVYIVYMGELPKESEYTPMSQHQNILQEIVERSLAQDILVHSYKRSLNGFSAKLTEKEVQKLSGKEGIVSIFPNRIFQLQTTRSWDFIGLPENVKRMPNVESDTIVGVIDTGIWPESASFSDNGFGPPPKKWKGVCDGGHNFICNNKLIGARYYEGLGSARDTKGHGTHTASTAAGNIVKGASFFEIAKGNARGAVTSARIAAYKVCGSDGCPSDAILAGFDDAISDGVDIISVSLSNSNPSGFSTDPIAIGSFHAVKKGILISQSAGNDGPTSQTVTSNAPWLLTVAASSTDRRLMDKIIFGNGKMFQGLGVNSFNLNGTEVPLVYGDNVSTQCDLLAAKGCKAGCLDRGLVRGKILICDSAASAVSETFTAGALGTIMITDPLEPWFDDSKVYPLPAVLINTTSGDLVRSYFKSTLNPVASILPTESIKDSEAPVVVSFSSRGPNLISPDIVKVKGKKFMHRAVTPGLVYDASADDYVRFLCGMGYDSSIVKLITNSTCHISKGTTTDEQQPRNLNYPSLGALVKVGKRMNVSFTRTMTNVGTTTPTTYKPKITTSNDKITFIEREKSVCYFVVNVIGHGLAGSYEKETASLVWSDEVHIVRSPIVVYTL